MISVIGVSSVYGAGFVVPHEPVPQSANPSANAQAEGCRYPNQLIANAQRFYSEWRRPSLEKAIAEYLKASDCFQQSSEPAAAADALKAVGDIYFILSEYRKSHDNYLQAFTLRKNLSDRGAEVGAIADIAHSLVYLGEKAQARRRAEEAVTLSENINDRDRQAEAHHALGTALLLGGDPRASLDSENRALALVNKTKDRELYARILLTLGYIHTDLDDLEHALTFYNDALREWRAIQHRWGESRTLTSMGLTQTLLGDSQSALDALEATLPVVEQMGERLLQAAALNNIAYAYQTLGELTQALNYFTKALNLYQEMKFALGEAITLQYCADVQAFLGNTEAAIASYDLAIAKTREVGNQLLLADGLNSLGSIYFTRGERQKALELFEQSLSEYRKANHWRGLASALSNLGYYHEVVSDKRKAWDYYVEALSFARSAQDRKAAATILYNLARIETSLGLMDAAQSHIEESLRINEASRAKVASQDLRISYFASVHQHYEFYIDLLMQQHRRHPNGGFDLKALQASEKARARSLLELLSQTRVSLRQTADPNLQQRERSLRNALNAEYLKNPDPSAQQSADTRRKLETEYEDVKNQIRATNFKYASIALPPNLELYEVQQQLLDSNTAILEYSLGDRTSFLWVVTSAGLKSYELPARSVLEQEAGKLLEYLASFGPDVRSSQPKLAHSQLETLYWQQSAKLSALLFQDALSQMTAKRLVIVADGVLLSVPYAALTKPANAVKQVDTPRALIEEYEVLNLPSISVLTVLKKQLSNRKGELNSVAIFADPVFDAKDPRLRQRKKSDAPESRPIHSSSSTQSAESRSRTVGFALRDSTFQNGIRRLIFSRQEARAILDVARNSFVALDFRANRATAVSGELSKYSIIHFATHGLLNSKHPELSGILLSMVDEKGAPRDGFVQLSDIYDLNLPAELIVLSACETGLGKTIKGEGLIGLTRGFMYAGAARVVASLWKVDDSATAALMAEFYKEMFTNKKRPAAALRDAQLHVSKQKRWRSPYYWAGFVLQGEWR